MFNEDANNFGTRNVILFDDVCPLSRMHFVDLEDRHRDILDSMKHYT